MKDTGQTGQTMTILEASTRLGITPEAVRKRIQRGTLGGYKIGRAWYVILPVRPDADQPPEDSDGTRPATTSPVIDALKAHIASLERQLEERAEELRRKDVLLQAFAQRLPELPPGRDSDEAPKKKRRWWPWGWGR